MLRRETFEKLKIGGNFYPMAGMAYIEDDTWRLTVAGNQPLGAASLDSGLLEIVHDRRFSRDDDRGLGQGVLDNVLTHIQFRVLIERRESDSAHRNDNYLGIPTVAANAVSESLLHPLFALQSHQPTIDVPVQSKSALFPQAVTSQLFPCDISLTHLRAISENNEWAFSNKVGVIFKRHAGDCNGFLQPVDERLGCDASAGKVSEVEIQRFLDFNIFNITHFVGKQYSMDSNVL
jgi:hypothetical protein